MGFDDTGLGAAMAESGLRSSNEHLRRRVESLERQVADLTAAVAYLLRVDADPNAKPGPQQ